MNITDRLARPPLALMFVSGGVDALRSLEGKVKAAEAVVQPLTERLPILPRDTETYIRFNAAMQIGGGVLLALGRFRRSAALALIGSLIPTTDAGHQFWEEVDEDRQAQQRIHLLKNLGLLGELISALGVGQGPRSGKLAGQS